MSKNRYEYQINGNNYVLRTDREKHETDKIVLYVNQKIKDAKRNINYKNEVMFATLACLNIADVLFEKEIEYNNLEEKSKEPLEKYGPLKEEFDLYKEKHRETDIKKRELENKIKEYQNLLDSSNNEIDKLRIELDKQIKLSNKNEEQNNKLMQELLNQEKLTLEANKKIQELIKQKD